MASILGAYLLRILRIRDNAASFLSAAISSALISRKTELQCCKRAWSIKGMNQ